MESIDKKIVFISYCHEDVSEEWIVKLMDALKNYNIECIVDFNDLKYGQDINSFMEKDPKKADNVLMLLGKEYKRRADNREKGVGIEVQLAADEIYNNVKQTKYIPVVVAKDEKGEAYLPNLLKSRLYIDFTNTVLYEENVKKLSGHILHTDDKVVFSEKNQKEIIFFSEKERTPKDFFEENRTRILQKKKNYRSSDIKYTENAYVELNIREKAGYMILPGEYSGKISESLGGDILSEAIVFILDYETDKLIDIIELDDEETIYYSKNEETFYCAVFAPGYELYVSEAVKVLTGEEELPWLEMYLEKENAKYSNLFQVQVRIQDVTKGDRWELFPENSGIDIEFINRYGLSSELNCISYGLWINETGMLSLTTRPAYFFALNMDYVMRVSLNGRDAETGEHLTSSESPHAIIDRINTNNNVVVANIIYNGDRFIIDS